MSKILVIDDDRDTIRLIQDYLSIQGEEVYAATNGEEGIQLLLKETIDCILLDILLQEENGFVLCQQIKKITEVPIVFLTNLDSEEDLKKGFLCGGDDYMTKPFSFMELHLRIKARIRQYQQLPTQKIISFPPLEIHLDTRSVKINEDKLLLTVSEFDILVLLATNTQKIFTISEIYQEVWKMPDMDNAHTVQVHIANLRKKLNMAYPQHHFIQTVWGKGYTFHEKSKGV